MKTLTPECNTEIRATYFAIAYDFCFEKVYIKTSAI
jgi:hypothetical protein